jgi:hypothetical protein
VQGLSSNGQGSREGVEIAGGHRDGAPNSPSASRFPMLHSQLGGRGFQQPRGGGAGYEQQQGEDVGLPNMMSHLMLHPDDEAQGGMSGFGRGMPFADGGGGRGLGGGPEFAPSGIGGGGGLGYNNMGLSSNNPGMRANQQSEGVRGVSRLFERAPAPQMGGGGNFENGGGMMEAKPAAVMGLVALGFHESSAREALFVCANNFERAYEFLLGQQGTHIPFTRLVWCSLPLSFFLFPTPVVMTRGMGESSLQHLYPPNACCTPRSAPYRELSVQSLSHMSALSMVQCVPSTTKGLPPSFWMYSTLGSHFHVPVMPATTRLSSVTSSLTL